MIRMVFMTDKARVIGASTPEGNAARFPMFPKDLPKAMQELYQAENIAVGELSLCLMHQPLKNRYVITRDPSYQPPVGLEDTIVCNDYMELVKRYKDSKDELLVAGGLTIFKLFLPFAYSLDVAESDELVPGDLIFNEWDQGDFELVSSKEWKGFKTLHFIRKN